MKRVFLFIVCLCAATITSFSQEKGDMGVGANVVVGSFSDSKNSVDFGIGVRFMYNVTKPIRLDGSFNYYFTETAPLDFSVNAHYLFNVMPKLNVYPLVGLSVYAFGDSDDDIDWDDEDYSTETTLGGLGLNIGGGVDYQLTDKIFGNAELKYDLGMGFAVSIGVVYKF
jgi:outer membrane protein X